MFKVYISHKTGNIFAVIHGSLIAVPLDNAETDQLVDFQQQGTEVDFQRVEDAEYLCAIEKKLE